MEIIKLTKKEEEWIKELKKVIRKKPKNLILFADGNLNILKLDKDDNDGVGENGRMKSDRIVEIILNACDGGVFYLYSSPSAEDKPSSYSFEKRKMI